MRELFHSPRNRLIAILLIAVALRLLAITSRPLWYDEAFAVLFAQKGFSAMLYGTLTPVGDAAADVHPLAYYSTLWGWMSLFGSSPLSVRILSVIFGVATLLVARQLARQLFGDSTADFVAFLIAISPFQVHYSQEIRMYAMLALFLIAATLFLWRAIKHRKWYWWVLFSIAAALAQYTHNLAFIYLLPLAFSPALFRKWSDLGLTFLAGLGSLVLYLPWLLQVQGQIAKVHQAYWTSRPTFARIMTALLSYVTNLPIPEKWLPLAVFITLLTVVLAGWQSVRAFRSGDVNIAYGIWMFYLAFSPLVLLFLISQIQPVFIERALLPSGVAFLMWIGWAFFSTKMPRIIRAGIFGLLFIGMLLGVVQHLVYVDFPYGPYEAMTDYLDEHVGINDVIVHSNKLTMLPSVYFNDTLSQKYVTDPPGSGADTLALPTQEILDLVAEPSVEAAVDDIDKVWFIIFNKAIAEYQEMNYETHPHLLWLGDHYELDQMQPWGPVRLFVFSSPR